MTQTATLTYTAFEELILSHDYYTYPCVGCWKIMVPGITVREHFEKSVDRILEQNPLMAATVKQLKSFSAEIAA